MDASTVSYCVVDFNFRRSDNGWLNVTELAIVAPREKQQQHWLFGRHLDSRQVPVILQDATCSFQYVYALGGEKASFVARNICRPVIDMSPMMERFPNLVSTTKFPCCMYHSEVSRHRCVLATCARLATTVMDYESNFSKYCLPWPQESVAPSVIGASRNIEIPPLAGPPPSPQRTPPPPPPQSAAAEVDDSDQSFDASCGSGRCYCDYGVTPTSSMLDTPMSSSSILPFCLEAGAAADAGSSSSGIPTTSL
jgi:hypothetical protein